MPTKLSSSNELRDRSEACPRAGATARVCDRKNALLLAIFLVFLGQNGAAAQLRPVEPLDWRGFSSQKSVGVSLGVGYLADQRVSLAGVRGDLVELGEVRVAVVRDRFQIEVAGTPQRLLRDERFVEAPTGDARAMSRERARHDAGDYRVATAIALSEPADGSYETLRFGTRLPTTDNKVGLDRDQTDFFAQLGLHRRWTRVTLGAEAGVSINGTRRPEYEQSDVLAYDVSVSYAGARLQPALVLVGQNDLRAERTRGNEDLAEVRGVLRLGSLRWVEGGVVMGLSEFSPGVGVVLRAGMQLGKAR